MKLWEYFDREGKKNGRPFNIAKKIRSNWQVVSKYNVHQMINTGISQSCVKKVRAELSDKGMFSTPKKRYSKPQIRVDADSFDRAAIRREIHKLYTERENLTLIKILVCNQ